MTSPDIVAKAAELAWIGHPSGGEEASAEARWQSYSSGAVVVAGPRGVHVVYGAIAGAYLGCGGPRGGLGTPVTDELPAGDGVGRYNDFTQGSIYWSPTTGAHEVHGNIGATWVAAGRAAGRLGYPITDELRHGDYAYQYFQRGALRWQPNTGTEHGSPPDRLFGVADTHAHPASFLGFGGRLVAGRVEGDPREALTACDEPHGPGGSGLRLADLVALPIYGVVQSLIEGVGLSALEGSLGHRTQGWPSFDGWPRSNSPVHQQMYLPWIERAYQHGVRTMVALACHSNLLARAFPGPGEVDDMRAGLAQVEYIKGLVDRTPWMDIALDPAEARRIVADDKLAVILGVELDTLGGLTQPAVDWTPSARSVSNAELDAVVAKLWDAQVRYVFPIHLTDNAFGGSAIYRDEFMTASAEQGRPIATQHDDRVAFGRTNRNGLSDAGRRLLTRLMDRGMLIDIDHMSWRATADALAHAEAAHAYPVVSGHATFHALAPSTVDTFHSGSDESRKTPETLAALRRLGSFVGVQPVSQQLAPHAGVDQHVSADCPGSSTQFARAYLYAVGEMGGRVTIGTDFNGFALSCGPRFGPNAAPAVESATSRRLVEEAQTGGVRYAAAVADPVQGRLERPGHMWEDERRLLLWAVHLAEAGRAAPVEVSLPGDLHVPSIVSGIRAAQEPPAGQERAAYRAHKGLDAGGLHGTDLRVYENLVWVLGRWSAARSGPNPPIDRCRTEHHDWDYNVEGLAHYGLIPDLLCDLANLGLAWDDELLPLMTSAETVVETWERCLDPGLRTAPLRARPADRRSLDPEVAHVVIPSHARVPVTRKAMRVTGAPPPGA